MHSNAGAWGRGVWGSGNEGKNLDNIQNLYDIKGRR